jgi:hypothetical protein
MAKVFTDLGAHSAAVPAAQQDTNLDLLAHDKQMASQMPQQRKAMIKGLTALNRSKLLFPQDGDRNAKRT